MGGLGSQPVARAQSRTTAQAQSRIGADGATARHDLADAQRSHVNHLGQAVLAVSEWL